MTYNYQDINLLLARKDNIENEEIKESNEYLLNPKDLNIKKPNWIDEFLKSNLDKMTETIARATSENKGLASTQGYYQSYFNEIIQNANDLHQGEYVDVKLTLNDDKVICKCEYEDSGFTISNIYGFLNREMSDKDSESGQTGKFGVGIKSLLSFTEEFKVISNILINLDVKNLNNSCIERNSEWDDQKTVLEFSYLKNKETGFDIKKLTLLADILNGEPTEEYKIQLKNMFTSLKWKELIFDVRSLIFTDVLKEPEINCIKFKGKKNTVVLSVNKLPNSEENKAHWNICKKEVRISFNEEVIYSEEVLVFKKTSEQLNGEKKEDKFSIAYPLKETLDFDRHYSIYYITSKKSLIDGTGAYIHTSFSNIHRTDLADNEDDRKNVLNYINENIKNLLMFMCSEQIEKQYYNKEISCIFHKLLYCCKNEPIMFDDEKINEKNIFSDIFKKRLTNEYLIKNQIESKRPYVVNRKENEQFEKVYVAIEGDITKKLRECYKTVIEKDEVLYLKEITKDEQAIDSVRNMYNYISKNLSENKWWIANILGYFSDVGSFIKFRISRYEEISGRHIGTWLEKNKLYFEESILLKLIGRYRLSQSIDLYGNIDEKNLSFVDYLFTDKIRAKANNIFGETLIKKFDVDYRDLKEELKRFRFTQNGKPIIKYIVPIGKSTNRWEGECGYYNILSSEVSILNEKLDLLIGRINNDDNLRYKLGEVEDNVSLFEKQRVKLKYGKRFVNEGIEEQQIVNLNFLKNLKVETFEKLKYYREVLDKCTLVNLTDAITCNIKRVTVKELSQKILPWFIKRKDQRQSLPSSGKFNIKDIDLSEQKDICNEEQKKFIKMLTGYNVYIFPMDSEENNKKHIVGYFGENKIKLKIGANNSFDENIIGKTGIEDKIIIFYSSAVEPQKAIDYVMSDLKISDNLKKFMSGYISYKNIGKTVRVDLYERLLKKNIESKEYFRVSYRKNNNWGIQNVENYEVLYNLLIARGSYDERCPLCSKKSFKEKDFLVCTIPNCNEFNRNDFPYIITLFCKECVESLRDSLVKAKFDGEDLVRIERKFYVGDHQNYSRIDDIFLSDINKAIILKGLGK